MKLTTSTELVGNASYAANVFEAAALRTPATKRQVRIRSEAQFEGESKLPSSAS